MKYFFLSQGWQIRRVWEAGGIWNEVAWRRKPTIERMGVYLVDRAEEMVLYRVEDAVHMVEVMPDPANPQAIGQVRIARMMNADRVLERIAPLAP